ncbi:MAG: hypothetical protein LBM94_04025 [Propionibacteriaceae bacterium]|jgi:hypothetical protein|nr:hypothetical protein [Propionibacteriaceae bacterium]
MSERTVDDVNRIIARIEHMPYGAARTAACLLECNKVEVEGPDECRAYAYNTLVESYNLGGEAEKAYVPFTRVVALFDTHPEWFDDKDRFDMFWSFKWMVNGLSDYPAVSKRQIDATLADMERRFAENSQGMDAPRQARFFWSWHIGDPNMETYLDEWIATPRDKMSDCILCVAGDRITYLALHGRLAEAEDQMNAILNDPDVRRSCRSEPGTMFAVMALAYLARNQPGDVAEAVRLYRRTRAFLDDSDQQLLSATGRCITFLAAGHNIDLALDYLQRHLDRLDQAESPMSRLSFLRGAGAAMRIIAEDLASANFPIPYATHGATVGELWEWIRAEAEALAAQFDVRNGSSAVSDELHLAWEARALPQPINLGLVPALDEALPEVPVPEVGFARDESDDAPRFAPSSSASASSPSPSPSSESGDEPASPASEPDSDADPLTLGPVETPLASTDLLAEAERAARRGNLEAVGLYIDTARAFEVEGSLQEAGFAWAEAGQVASKNEDHAGAERCFTRSMRLLHVIETPINYVVPIGLSLIETLSKQRRWAEADALIAQLHTQVTDALLALESANKDDSDKRKAEQLKSKLLQTDLELDNASAGIAFAQGDLLLGGTRAIAVAEAMADLGNVRAAAGAFVNAGESLAQVPDERAIYAFESAMEAWSILRMRDNRMAAANHLIDALRAFGRNDQADELAQNL